jgi:TatD family-associated radical SAM protein
LWLDREPNVNEIWSNLVDEVRISDAEAVWCGFGEPTIRLDDVVDLAMRIRKGYPNLKVRLDTDGLAQLRNKDREVARELKDAGIDSVSISLNAESEEKYVELCRPSLLGSYQAVLDFARDCKKYFSQVMLTVVNFRDIDICKCKEIAQALGCNFRVRGSR